ncbi:hypothetical protein GCM10027273_39960 [Nocardioides pakistanensis]
MTDAAEADAAEADAAEADAAEADAAEAVAAVGRGLTRPRSDRNIAPALATRGPSAALGDEGGQAGRHQPRRTP